VWVARYDEVARVAEIWTRRSSIGPSGNEQGNPAVIPLRADRVLSSRISATDFE
jgi:hypothetical protein